MTEAAAESHDVRDVQVPAAGLSLAGALGLPARPLGVVLFAHGSGSSRLSPRNRAVAATLREAGLATLLMDLLTPAEERIDARTAELRFDVKLLATRLAGAVEWLAEHPHTRALDIGMFGASTGAAAALMAAVERPANVRAVVSRGGRPDLAGAALSQVRASTLLIVGGADVPVIAMNRDALAKLRTEKKLEIVPGATHLFEEPGALDRVASRARDWFLRYLPATASTPDDDGANQTVR